MYRVGIIGMGVGENHLRAFESHEMCDVGGICDFDAIKQDYCVKKYPKYSFTANCNDVIDNNMIDIVSIASYDNYHCKQVVKSINNKKHIMVEKPMCLNSDELKIIVKALKQNPDVVLSSNLVLRANSRFSFFRDQIKSGSLGDVYYIEADYYWGRLSKLYGWRADMDYYSIILGAAIHMIDLAIWFMDETPVNIYAVGNRIGTFDSKQKYNSFAMLSLEFESGLIIKVTGNGSCVHPHFHGVKIFGTKKTIVHSFNGAYFLDSNSADDQPTLVKENYPEKEKRKDIIHSFVNHLINKQKKPIVSAKETIDLMSICIAAEESMNTNKIVTIPYIEF